MSDWNGNLKYSVVEIKTSIVDALFQDLDDAFLWKDTENDSDGFEVRDLKTGKSIERPVHPIIRRNKRRNLWERIGKKK